MAQAESNTIVVAGAAGHLGRAVVRKLLSEGKHVVSFCQTEAQAQDLHTELADAHRTAKHLAIAGDLNRADHVGTLLAKANAFLGSIDAVISTAGAFRYASVEESTDADYEALFASNFKSSWHLAQAVLPQMKKARSGRLLFVSSKGTQGLGTEGMSLYLASKAALNMLTLCLAREVREHGITVNAVMPTIIDTPTNRKDMPNADFRQWVSTQDLANLIVSLMSKELGAINGALISAPGKL